MKDENKSDDGPEACPFCRAPMRMVRVPSVETVTGPTGDDTIWLCTTPGCDAHQPWRPIAAP